MRALLTLVAAGLLLPVLISPAEAEGVLYTYEGKVKMVRNEHLLPRCINDFANFRLDLVTPLRTNVPTLNAVAVLTVEGGPCEDSNVTFVAKSQGDTWTFTDYALKSQGVISRDATPNGTYGVSFALKNVTTDTLAYTSIYANSGVRLLTTPE